MQRTEGVEQFRPQHRERAAGSKIHLVRSVCQMPIDEIGKKLLILRLTPPHHCVKGGKIGRFFRQRRENICPVLLQTLQRQQKFRPLLHGFLALSAAAKTQGFPHALCKGLFPPRKQCQNLIPQGNGLVLFPAVAHDHKAQRIVFPEDQPSRRLTAEPETRFDASRQLTAKARMVGADLAEVLLPQLGDNIAEVLFVQKGAALVRAKGKAGRISAVDAAAHPLPQFPVHGVIKRQRLLVHIDLPADAAVVAALPCDAVEVLVIIRKYLQHIVSPSQDPAADGSGIPFLSYSFASSMRWMPQETVRLPLRQRMASIIALVRL